MADQKICFPRSCQILEFLAIEVDFDVLSKKCIDGFFIWARRTNSKNS